jgi:regulator of sigma E protease
MDPRGGPRLESRFVNILATFDSGLLLAFDFAPYLSKGGSILAVLIGIGLVIFFHELGHFAVAKWCDVFVERFSIGFGPILWSRKYGETEYALSAIPFGGYVKMLGQDDMDPSQLTSEEIARDPRSYSAKSVGQRMAIISAGVTMNVITAVMFYAIAFGHGIEMPPPVIGSLQPGFPAWEAGLHSGDRISSIGGRTTTTFEDIQRAIAFTSGPIEVKGVHADGTAFEMQMTPSIFAGRRMIGVAPSQGLELIKPRDSAEPVADPGSPAAGAKPGFEPGDRIVGLDKQAISNFTELQHLLAADRSKPVEFLVHRDNGPEKPVAIRVEPQRFRQLGLTMDIGKITALVNDSPAQRNGILVGDKILRVNNRSVGTDIDPLRLPDELASLAGREVTVVVQRDVKGADSKNFPIRLIPSNNPGWVEHMPAQDDIPLAAPAIGVAYNVIPAVLNVAPNSPADKAGIKKGEMVKKVELVLPTGMTSDLFGKNTIVVDFADSKTKSANWAYVGLLMQLATDRQVQLTLSDGSHPALLTPVVDAKDNWFVPGLRGLRVYPQFMLLKSDGLLDAAKMGLTNTRNSIIDLYLTLRNLLTGQLSVENLHGPLGIASVAYDFARQGLAEMSLFLGILSANLAVLNFLPIPVLDGGHMVFLIWEGVTRKRPSERVQIAATYFGMAFVLCLAFLVFYLDLFVHHVIG